MNRASSAIEKAQESLRFNLEKAKAAELTAFRLRPGLHLGGKIDLLALPFLVTVLYLRRFEGNPFKIYQDLLTESGFETFKEFDRYVESNCQEPLEKLWQVEDDWDEFLAKVSTSEPSFQPKVVGDVLHSDVEGFEDVRSGEELALNQILTTAKWTHLVLLRHYAWVPWRRHLSALELRKGMYRPDHLFGSLKNTLALFVLSKN